MSKRSFLVDSDVRWYIRAAGDWLKEGCRLEHVYRTRNLGLDKKLLGRFVIANLIKFLRSQRLFLLVKALHSAQLAAQPEPLNFVQS